MNWLAGLLLLAFCTAHGIAAIAGAVRRNDVVDRGAGFGVPGWAIWAWVIATQAGNFAALRVIEGDSVGLPIGAAALVGVCGLAIANGCWMKGGPTISHHVIRAAVAAAILALAAISL